MSQAGMASSTGGGSGRVIVDIATFNPNAVLQEFDDFLGSTGASDQLTSKLRWQGLRSLASLPGTVNNPGILSFPAAAGDSALFLENENPADIGCIALGGGITSVSWIINLSALSAGGNTYRFSVGLADSATIIGGTDAFVNGIYFQYTDAVNGGQWTLKSTNTSVTTTVNTATAAAAGSFVTLSVIANSGGTSVSYYINGTQVGTAITTNIPTAALTPFVYAHVLGGTIPQISIDLFYCNIMLATPRPGPTTTSTIVGTGMLIEQYHQTGVNYQVLATDAIIGCSAGSITITLPATPAATGQRFTIKDESGTAAASNITVSGNGKNIDVAATYVINTNYGAVDIYYNGTQFYII